MSKQEIAINSLIPKRFPLISRLDEEIHPMKNDAILQTFFSVCGSKDLSNFRLVCKQWQKVSLEYWRKQAVVRIVKKTNVNRNNRKWTTVEELPEAYNMAIKPFHRYNICCYHFVDAEQWLRLSLGIMTHLELTSCDLKLSEFKELICIAANLSTLKLWSILIKNDYGGKEKTLPHYNIFPRNHNKLRNLQVTEWRSSLQYGEFLMAILPRLPKLEKLKLDFAKASDGYVPDCFKYSLLVKLLRWLKEKGVVLKLKSLDLMNMASWPDNLFRVDLRMALKKAALPLEELAVDVGAYTPEPNIRLILSPYRRTLKRLHLFRNPNHVDMPSPGNDCIVHLDVLEELCLEEGITSGFHFLNVLKAPKLKKLVIFDAEKSSKMKMVNHVTELSTTSQVISSNLNLKGLEIFHLHHIIPRDCTDKLFQLLRKAMPNLKELAMPLSSRTFPIVCQSWKKLRVLTVYGRRKDEWRSGWDWPVNDKTIAGIHSQEITEKVQRCITALKELTHFTMEPTWDDEWKYETGQRVSDHAVFKGFLRLPQLSYLKVDMKHVSDMGKKALEEKFPHVQLDTWGEYADPAYHQYRLF